MKKPPLALITLFASTNLMAATTAGNDFIFLPTSLQAINQTYTNAYSGDTFTANNTYNVLNTSIDGLGGTDRILGTSNNELIDINSSNTVSNVEIFIGVNNDDFINLSSQTKVLGDTELYGGAGNDTLWANSGNDFISGANGDDFIDGGPGNDRLLGQGDNDIIKGGDGDDELRGGHGNDQLFGDDGNDILWGDYGINTLDGGEGSDIFHADISGSTIHTGSGYDLIFAPHSTDRDDLPVTDITTVSDFSTDDAFTVQNILDGYDNNSMISDYIKFQQIGLDTHVFVDQDGINPVTHLDGTITNYTFTKTMILQNVSSSLLLFGELSDLVGADERTEIYNSLGESYVTKLFYLSDVTAVPVPTAAWLFAPALLGFMGLRRKAKRA